MPEQLDFLNTIDTSFKAVGRSDCRIAIEPENRFRRGFGGVAMLWRKDLKVTPLIEDGNDRIISICIDTKSSYVYVIGVLMPSTNLAHQEFIDTVLCLNDLYDKYIEMGSVIVMGDFNAHLSKRCGIKNHNEANERGLVIEKFIQDHNLISVNSQSWSRGPNYTYISGDGSHTSMIDHILIENSKVDLIDFCCINDDHSLNISDHRPIQLNFRTICHKRETQPLSTAINWKKVTSEHISNYHKQLDMLLDQINKPTDISQLADIMNIAAKSSFPVKRYRHYLKPYWKYNNVKSLHTNMRHLRSVWIDEGRPRGHAHKTYSEYKGTKKLFRNELNLAREQYEREQFEKLESLAELDIGTFYKAIRTKRSINKHSSSYELLVDGQIIRDSDILREAWYEHFRGLSSPLNETHFDNLFKKQIESEVEDMYANSFNNTDGICDCPITVLEVKHAMKCMNTGKAGGHDGIVLEHIKYASNNMLDTIVSCFNGMIENFNKVSESNVEVSLQHLR
ncbi:uncharacterized protein [Argopecten irradians]|uniref:uncharacterized protein n=1 Tax=Argopecten irradians TaxID=31199 RepID=UPI003720D12C